MTSQSSEFNPITVSETGSEPVAENSQDPLGRRAFVKLGLLLGGALFVDGRRSRKIPGLPHSEMVDDRELDQGITAQVLTGDEFLASPINQTGFYTRLFANVETALKEKTQDVSPDATFQLKVIQLNEQTGTVIQSRPYILVEVNQGSSGMKPFVAAVIEDAPGEYHAQTLIPEDRRSTADPRRIKGVLGLKGSDGKLTPVLTFPVALGVYDEYTPAQRNKITVGFHPWDPRRDAPPRYVSVSQRGKTALISYSPVALAPNPTSMPVARPEATAQPAGIELSPLVEGNIVCADTRGLLCLGGRATIIPERGEKMVQLALDSFAESFQNQAFMQDLLGTSHPTAAALGKYLDEHDNFFPGVSPSGIPFLWPRRHISENVYHSFVVNEALQNGFKFQLRTVSYTVNEWNQDRNGIRTFLESLQISDRSTLTEGWDRQLEYGFGLAPDNSLVFFVGSRNPAIGDSAVRRDIVLGGDTGDELKPGHEQVITAALMNYLNILKRWGEIRTSACLSIDDRFCDISGRTPVNVYWGDVKDPFIKISSNK